MVDWWMVGLVLRQPWGASYLTLPVLSRLESVRGSKFHLLCRISHQTCFPTWILSGMNICLRQMQGNVVAADDTYVAGLNQIRPRQFYPTR